MAIVNSDTQLYRVAGLPGDASFAAFQALGGDLTAEVYARFKDATLTGSLSLTGDLKPDAYTTGDLVFDAGLNSGGDFAFDTALVLQNPDPITISIAADAFSNQHYAGGGRLFINNVETPIVSAEIIAPPGSLGKLLRIELASAARAQIPDGATLKFQIGKIIAGQSVWTTILDGGKLEGRQFSMTATRDTLSFSSFEANSKLNKFPKNNLIVYDELKAHISTDEIEPLAANTRELILTSARQVAVLTLRKLLEIAFVEGCGFSSVETDLPNYEIARCDFTVGATYYDAVKQFIGMYEPDFTIIGDGLRIQKTIDPLPSGFTPHPITAANYPNFSENLQNNSPNLDGYILSYTGGAGSFYVERYEPPTVEKSGVFGESDFTETTVTKRYLDWFEADDPVSSVRSELASEIRETRRGGIIVGTETQENNFDLTGKSLGYTKISRARMPDVTQNGAPSLLKTREEKQSIEYGANPFSPRRTVTLRVETRRSTLLAIDADNPALDEHGDDAPYAQEYERVYEAGNLKKEMTADFRVSEVEVEHFTPLRNGQIEVRLERFDALRGKNRPSETSLRSGDASVPNFAKQKTRVIFRTGITQAGRSGELKTYNAGELPLFFAQPLLKWLLDNPRCTGSIELIGWDASVERGISFTLLGRNNETLGKFLIRGYRALIKPNSIMTQLDTIKVG